MPERAVAGAEDARRDDAATDAPRESIDVERRDVDGVDAIESNASPTPATDGDDDDDGAATTNDDDGADKASDSRERTVFIGGTSHECDEARVRRFFEDEHDARVECVKLIYDRQTQVRKGYGFVKFYSVEDANRVKAMGKVTIDGKAVDAKEATRDEPASAGEGRAREGRHERTRSHGSGRMSRGSSHNSLSDHMGRMSVGNGARVSGGAPPRVSAGGGARTRAAPRRPRRSCLDRRITSVDWTTGRAGARAVSGRTVARRGRRTPSFAEGFRWKPRPRRSGGSSRTTAPCSA